MIFKQKYYSVNMLSLTLIHTTVNYKTFKYQKHWIFFKKIQKYKPLLFKHAGNGNDHNCNECQDYGHRNDNCDKKLFANYFIFIRI